jgi:pimeloyl-ACP methyl ester carboxylesterase
VSVLEKLRIGTGEAVISVSRGGTGPGVLLLHGFPQAQLMWRDIAPRLAQRFTVVCADLHAICEEYRAAAGIDRDHDAADRAAGRRISCPVLALWSASGPLSSWYDDDGGPLALWGELATKVSGGPVNGGHFFPEERPSAIADALSGFFSR